MIPSEKAEDLIDSFVRDGYDIVMSEKLAIRCALIAVDEIINTGALGSLLEEYYLQVKQELENFKSIA
jgi:hypothetical protein